MARRWLRAAPLPGPAAGVLDARAVRHGDRRVRLRLWMVRAPIPGTLTLQREYAPPPPRQRCRARRRIANDCSVGTCPDGCSGRGYCLGGKCACVPGWQGDACNEVSAAAAEVAAAAGREALAAAPLSPTAKAADVAAAAARAAAEAAACPRDCSGRGTCVGGECVCREGYGRTPSARGAAGRPEEDADAAEVEEAARSAAATAAAAAHARALAAAREDCSHLRCAQDCTGHGQCDGRLGLCTCDHGWSGADCSRPSCPSGCHGHGYCLGGACACQDCWRGADCATRDADCIRARDPCAGSARGEPRCRRHASRTLSARAAAARAAALALLAKQPPRHVGAVEDAGAAPRGAREPAGPRPSPAAQTAGTAQRRRAADGATVVEASGAPPRGASHGASSGGWVRWVAGQVVEEAVVDGRHVMASGLCVLMLSFVFVAWRVMNAQVAMNYGIVR